MGLGIGFELVANLFLLTNHGVTKRDFGVAKL